MISARAMTLNGSRVGEVQRLNPQHTPVDYYNPKYIIKNKWLQEKRAGFGRSEAKPATLCYMT
jgi:hypothetical protein